MNKAILRSMGLLKTTTIDARQIDVLVDEILGIAETDQGIVDPARAKALRKAKARIVVARWIQRNVE